MKTISAAELDKKFDDGEDINEYIDWSTARRPGLEPKRVNVDFPTWMVTALDREARLLGITRQALIKTGIAEKLRWLLHHASRATNVMPGANSKAVLSDAAVAMAICGSSIHSSVQAAPDRSCSCTSA